MLGFTVRTPAAPGWFEVAISADPALFRGDRRQDRTSATFWSSRDTGPLLAENGEAVYLVPTRALASLASNRLLYFALATFEEPDGRGRRVWMPDPAAASSVRIDATFEAERRVALLPNRAPATYGVSVPPPGWAGDDEPLPATGNPPADQEKTAMYNNGTTTQEFVYDDGLGTEFWQAQAAATATDDPSSAYGIDGPIPATYESTDLAAAAAMPMQSAQTPDYPQASRFVPAAPGNFRPASGRTIDRVVIHITDGGPNINGTIRWFQDPAAQVSSHYIVGQDGEVVQMVRDADVAYHARAANGRSIGIEHVANTRGLVPTEAQYCASAALVRWLCETYRIPMDRQHILGHREAVQTSKTCPGDWDWAYHMGMITSATCYPRPAAQQLAPAYPMSHAPVQQAIPAAVPIVSSIVGATMTRILGNQGDVSWSLDQVNGWKHPGDQARSVNTASVRNQTLTVPGPKAATVFGVDEIYANLRIRFDYDGRSVGNISQQVVQANDAAGAGLVVTATVHDVGQVSPSASDPNAYSAVRIEIHYRFTHVYQDDKIALRDLTIFGNGTFRDSFRWTQ